MTRTPAQQLGFFILLAANQPTSFTGRLTFEFEFYGGALKECSVVSLQRRIDLQRLNESNKTIDKSESVSYIPSNA